MVDDSRQSHDVRCVGLSEHLEEHRIRSVAPCASRCAFQSNMNVSVQSRCSYESDFNGRADQLWNTAQPSKLTKIVDVNMVYICTDELTSLP